MKIKCAIYETQGIKIVANAVFKGSKDYREGFKTVRISEYVDIDFPMLKNHEIITELSKLLDDKMAEVNKLGPYPGSDKGKEIKKQLDNEIRELRKRIIELQDEQNQNNSNR